MKRQPEPHSDSAKSPLISDQANLLGALCVLCGSSRFGFNFARNVECNVVGKLEAGLHMKAFTS
jgi:hypothetical protein